jgi:signal peptidase I
MKEEIIVNETIDQQIKQKRLNRILTAVFAVFFVIAVVLVSLKLFVFPSYTVNGPSMLPTIENGEKLWFNTLKKPQRFDVIAFDAAEYFEKAGIDDESDKLLKRVVGVGGDVLKTRRDSSGKYWLEINGEPLFDEDYGGGKLQSLWYWTTDSAGKPMSYAGFDKEITVKEGYVFVLGDMRNLYRNGDDGKDYHSVDSRMLGQILIEDIIGIAI